ncbi:MAG: glycosyltransferase family 4 protein [Rhodothermales bacterium]
MSASTDILFALTGDVHRNSRALKQLRVFGAMGLHTTVLTLGDGPAPPNLPNTRLISVALPPARGPRHFWNVHQTFARHAEQVTARVYHASDLYVLPALNRARQRRQPTAKLVYDARECYPHVASTVGRPWVTAVWKRVERRALRHADAVFTVSDSIADWMVATYGIRRPQLLHNVPAYQAVPPTNDLREQLGLTDDTPIILHQGQMRKYRGCAWLVEAMAHVHDAHLVFLGRGLLQLELAARAEALGLSARVHFLPPVPPDALLPVTASADIGVTLLEDVCLNHRYALPNKLFEYLMAGLPVVASALPECRRVVEAHGVGHIVDPTDTAQLADTLRIMLAERVLWRQRVNQHVTTVFETFSWEMASQRLTETYTTLLAGDLL